MERVKENTVRFARIFIKRCQQASLVSSAVYIAFYALLSLFPFLIFLGNLLPLFHITPDGLVEYLSILIPEALLPAVKPIMLSLLQSSSGGLLSISTIALLWSSSRVISCLQNSMNAAYGISRDRNYVVRRLVGFVSVLLFLGSSAILLLLLSFSDMLISFLSPVFGWLSSMQNTIENLKWPVVLILVFFLLVQVYLITPSAKVRIKEAMPGALFSTLGLLILVQLFAFYVRVATRSLSSYGALSSFFILMFWLEYSAMTVVVGALLNASIREYRFGADSLQKSKLDEWNSMLDNKVSSYMKKRYERIKKQKTEKTPPVLKENNEDKGETHE